MGITLKSIMLFFLTALLFGNAFAEDRSMITVYSEPRSHIYSERDLLKNWVLSICLANISRDGSETRHDAARSAWGYFEFSNISLEERDELVPLIMKVIAEKNSRLNDGDAELSELNTMKCIDLFHSARLDGIVARMLKERGNRQ
jgi:hypothetical protein